MKIKASCIPVFGIFSLLAPAVNAQWPEAIYRLLDVDIAETVSRGPLTANTYLLLGSEAEPYYINLSSTVDVTTLIPTSARTIELRFFCEDKCAVTEAEMEIIIDQLQSRIQALYLGINLEWQLTVGAATRGDADAVTIVIDPESAGIYHADPLSRTISLSTGGLEPRILLHELGHILGLPHRDNCCNICTDISMHFMYEYLSDVAVTDQIMIQDWLEVIDACRSNTLCSGCPTLSQRYPEETDFGAIGAAGIGKSYVQNASLVSWQDTVKKGQLISVQQYLDCIDCAVEFVDTGSIQEDELIRLISKIPNGRQLRAKYREEFERYNSGRLDLTQKEIQKYIESQVRRRQSFYFERATKLVEFRLRHTHEPLVRERLQKVRNKIINRHR